VACEQKTTPKYQKTSVNNEFSDLARGSIVFGILTLCGLLMFYFADKDLIGGYWTNRFSTILMNRFSRIL
jgi:hypothetical protein